MDQSSFLIIVSLTCSVTCCSGYFLLGEECLVFVLRTAQYSHQLWVRDTWHQTRRWLLELCRVSCTKRVWLSEFREVVGLHIAELTILLPNIYLSKLVEAHLWCNYPIAVIWLLNMLQKAFFSFWNLKSISGAAYL